jgi:cellulose synthase/poly-beta-1,6-N-acetylglucosamine synthase-like glycosyltransferase
MRNAGAGKACGKYLLFIDDDVVLASDFFAVLHALLQRATAAGEPPLGALGPRLPGTAQTLPARLTDLSNFWSQQGFSPGDRNWLYSAALVIPATAFRAAGGFNPALRIGEDVDLTMRIARAGRRVRFEPSLVAWHRHGRDTFSRMWRYFWTNGGAARFLHQHYNHPRCFSVPTAWRRALHDARSNWTLNRNDLPELSRLLPGVFLNYLLFQLSVEWHHQSNLWQDGQFARLVPARPSDTFTQQAFSDFRAARRWRGLLRYARAVWLDLRDAPRR